MDLHALSQGRTALLTRGGIAFLVGLVVSNGLGSSAHMLVVVWGLWALAEGLILLREAYPRAGASRAEAPPVLLLLGGVSVAVGVLAVVVPGLSEGAVTWVLAGWLALRAVFEGMGAFTARSKARVLLGAAALVDLALVATFVTHTTGDVTNLALVGGGIASLWGLLYLGLGLVAEHVQVVTAAPPPLLSRR